MIRRHSEAKQHKSLRMAKSFPFMRPSPFDLVVVARRTLDLNSPRSEKGSVLDIKLIKQVVDLMACSELSEFEFEEDGFKLRLRRRCDEAPTLQLQGGLQLQGASAASGATPQQAPAPPLAAEAPGPPAEEVGVSIIKSPMVGTFYRAASPENAALTDVGRKVSADTIVCIIEAMKVMNEIQAELRGIVTEVLVENGEAVEYGQPLFKVKIA